MSAPLPRFLPKARRLVPMVPNEVRSGAISWQF